MSKTIRNTFFTISILVLTSVGLKWHKAVGASQADPALSPSLLAGAQSGLTPAFAVTADYLRPIVELGQTQLLTITTVPGSVVEVTTRTTDGQVVHALTKRVTSQTGLVTLRTKLTKFDELGPITTIIRATNGGQAVVQTLRFQTVAAAQNDHHRYPLLP